VIVAAAVYLAVFVLEVAEVVAVSIRIAAEVLKQRQFSLSIQVALYTWSSTYDHKNISYLNPRT
jgi:hypothetical protein